MPKGENQKIKLLCLLEIFLKETDDEHGLTLREIVSRLAEKNITVERKTLYDDFEVLREFGIDVISTNAGRSTRYFLGSRILELPEMKLLVDSIQASKFITEKRSREMIHKLEQLVSKYQAKELNRQVVIADRGKAGNKQNTINVDKIYTAINQNAQIRFHYFQWSVEREQILRRNGDWYYVSPWAMLWNDSNYYLVAYDNASEDIRHFRVDKMLNIDILDRERVGHELFSQFNVARYSKRMFGMYGGEEKTVFLEGENALAGVLIDRFGDDLLMTKKDDEHFTASVTVAMSHQFIGWLFGLGNGIRVTGPPDVLEEVKRASETFYRTYSD